MKKLVLASCIIIASITMLTSCIGEGSNQVSNWWYGVVELDSKTMKPVIASNAFNPYKFYSPTLSSLDLYPGDPVLFSFTYDLSDETNTNYGTTGLITGALNAAPSVLDEWYCDGHMQDTTMLLPDEQPIAYAIDQQYGLDLFYLSTPKILFLNTSITQLTDQKMTWELYYDPELPVTEEQGRRVYSLFLRATLRIAGKNPTQNAVVSNAFDMRTFYNTVVQKEKNQGNKTFSFRINHINKINEDGTFEWTVSDIVQRDIPDDSAS